MLGSLGKNLRRMGVNSIQNMPRSHTRTLKGLGVGNIEDLAKSRFSGLMMGMLEEEGREIDKVSTTSPSLAVTGNRR